MKFSVSLPGGPTRISEIIIGKDMMEEVAGHL